MAIRCLRLIARTDACATRQVFNGYAAARESREPIATCLRQLSNGYPLLLVIRPNRLRRYFRQTSNGISSARSAASSTQ
jgi:hypothetical protein